MRHGGGIGGGGEALRIGVWLVWKAAERLGAVTWGLIGGISCPRASKGSVRSER